MLNTIRSDGPTSSVDRSESNPKFHGFLSNSTQCTAQFFRRLRTGKPGFRKAPQPLDVLIRPRTHDSPLTLCHHDAPYKSNPYTDRPSSYISDPPATVESAGKHSSEDSLGEMRIRHGRRLIVNTARIMVVSVALDHNNNRSNNNTIALGNWGPLRTPHLIGYR